MSDATRRLRRLEAKVSKLPPGEAEREAAGERLRCRYTLLLEVKRSVIHGLLRASGVPLPDYEQVNPTGEVLEAIRAHHKTWRLPVASEKSAEEAQAHLGPDSPEQALADAKLRGALWRIWVEEQYIPAWEAMKQGEETGDRGPLFKWVEETVTREAQEDQARPRPDPYDRVMARYRSRTARGATTQGEDAESGE